MPRRMGSTHKDGEYAYQHDGAMDEETIGREEESIPVFEFADDLNGLVYGLECKVLVPPMRGQHIAPEMLRETTETVVGEQDGVIRLIQGEKPELSALTDPVEESYSLHRTFQRTAEGKAWVANLD